MNSVWSSAGYNPIKFLAGTFTNILFLEVRLYARLLFDNQNTTGYSEIFIASDSMIVPPIATSMIMNYRACISNLHSSLDYNRVFFLDIFAIRIVNDSFQKFRIGKSPLFFLSSIRRALRHWWPGVNYPRPQVVNKHRGVIAQPFNTSGMNEPHHSFVCDPNILAGIRFRIIADNQKAQDEEMNENVTFEKYENERKVHIPAW